MSATVVIAAVDQWVVTRDLVQRIKELGPDFEIVVVCAGSNRNHRYNFENNLPGTKPVILLQARGLAASWNEGLVDATNEYIFLMHNDVFPTPYMFETMLAIAQSDPEVGIVAPMLFESSNPQQATPFAKYGSSVQLDNFARDFRASRIGQVEKSAAVDDALILVKRELVDAIGYFDMQFNPCTFVGDDYCLRAALAGYSTVLAKDCYAHHSGGLTLKHLKLTYSRVKFENEQRFNQKWKYLDPLFIKSIARSPAFYHVPYKSVRRPADYQYPSRRRKGYVES